jgi:hypothetical protein
MSLTQILSSRPKHRASAMRSGETCSVFALAVASFALAVASEIGPGFSPDISQPSTEGFSPWGMLPLAETTTSWISQFLLPRLHKLPDSSHNQLVYASSKKRNQAPCNKSDCFGPKVSHVLIETVGLKIEKGIDT